MSSVWPLSPPFSFETRMVASSKQMNLFIVIRLPLACSVLSFWLSANADSLVDGGLPDASAVMNRVVQRAEEMARTGVARKYGYEKRSVTEEFDASGKTTKSTEEIYEVVPIGGISFSRLVKIQNRDLTEQEIKAQNRKEEEFRRKVAGMNSEQLAEEKDDSLDMHLIERYDFKVEGRDSFRNR